MIDTFYIFYSVKSTFFMWFYHKLIITNLFGVMMKIKFIVIVACIIMLLTACLWSDKPSDKLSDLEFTVVGEQEQPDTLKDIITEKGELPFQLSYSVGDDLYIAVGYGIQQSAGYSITVNEFYETKDNIVLDTSLLGPGSAENVTDTTSIPYIVIKTHNIDDKIIEFK